MNTYNQQVVKPSVTLYTDGSYKGSTGRGGYAGVMLDALTGNWIASYGNANETTNNQMELLAVVASLRQLNQPCNVHVVSDSKYVVGGITGWIFGWVHNGWVTSSGSPVANSHIWAEMWELMQVHNVSATWVKGHRGHRENELCDQIACYAATH